MEQWTVLGLAAILWPLLAAFIGWVCQMPSKDRARCLLRIVSGAVAGIGLAALFAWPAVIHRGGASPLLVLLSSQKMWFQYAVAAPLGALIALFLAQSTEKIP
jgi:hypothetical protein